VLKSCATLRDDNGGDYLEAKATTENLRCAQNDKRKAEADSSAALRNDKRLRQNDERKTEADSLWE